MLPGAIALASHVQCLPCQAEILTMLFLDMVITVIHFDENCINNLLQSLALAGFC